MLAKIRFCEKRDLGLALSIAVCAAVLFWERGRVWRCLVFSGDRAFGTLFKIWTKRRPDLHFRCVPLNRHKTNTPLPTPPRVVPPVDLLLLRHLVLFQLVPGHVAEDAEGGPVPEEREVVGLREVGDDLFCVPHANIS